MDETPIKKPAETPAETLDKILTPEDHPSDASQKISLESKKKKSPPDGYIKFPKKLIVAIVVVCVLGLFALLAWQLGAYNKVSNYLRPAQVTVTVTDKDTGQPVHDASIVIAEAKSTTNDKGVAMLEKIAPGEVDIKITEKDYKEYSGKVTLVRSSNELHYALSTLVEHFAVAGKVIDYVSEKPLAGVTISLAGAEVTSDKDGLFTIKQATAQKVELSMKKEGFAVKKETVTPVKGTDLELTLSPDGRFTFVSNRDGGKRGIYSVNYDGSDIKQVIKRLDDTEDYGVVISPDETKLAFLSTREKRKQENGASYEPSLYMMSANGENFIKVSGDFAIGNIKWSTDNKYLGWQSSVKVNEGSNIYIYNVANKKVIQLNSQSISSQFEFNHTGNKVLYVQGQQNGNPVSEMGIFFKDLSSGAVVKVDSINVYGAQFTNDDTGIRYTYYDSIARKTKYTEYTIATQSKKDYLPDTAGESFKVASPDKKLYAYVATRDGKNDVFISDSDGKNEKRLTSMGTVTSIYNWEKGGRYILFTSSRQDETASYIVSLDGGKSKKIVDIFSDGRNQNYYSL